VSLTPQSSRARRRSAGRLDPAIAGEVAAPLPKTTDLDAVRRTLRAAAGDG
jgi:hypothetical protein